MHKAPNQEQKYIFINQNKWGLLLGGLLSTIILVLGNMFFIASNKYFLFYGLFVAVVTFYLIISYVVGFMGRPFSLAFHKYIKEKYIDFAEAANVDVYLPVCGEPIEVIRNTWGAVWAMAAHHHNVNVYVLDDGKSDELKDLAKKLGFNYIRRETNELKKAGNMRNAFKNTNGDFIAVFDADFCPRRDFLEETLPYMAWDSKVAIVQTPQFFDTYETNTWIQNGSASIQELFYRLIQVNRNSFNGAICVGTCALYRRSALEPFGGTAPIEYSEDVHTGFQLISTGWKIEYLPIALSQGMCPETIRQYFTQQYRWALGSISLFFSRKFWQSGISAGQTVCYMSGMLYYISTGIGLLFVPLPSILMLIFYPEKIFWFNLLFSVPSLLYSTFYMWHWQKTKFSMAQIRARHISYFCHLFALKDYLMGSLEEWIPTGAKSTSKRYETFKKLYVVHTGLIPVVISFLITIRLFQGYDPKIFVLLFLFTAYNFFIAAPVVKDLD